MPAGGSGFRRPHPSRPDPANTRCRRGGLVKQAAFAKFDETVDVAVTSASIRATPTRWCAARWSAPRHRQVGRVLVIAQGDKAKEAEAAGADFVGVEYIQKIKDGWLDCDVIVATPDVMGQLGQLGRVLGPRGLMPNPKAGTVTLDVDQGGPRDQGRQDRVPGRQDRQRPRPDGQGLVLPEQLADNVQAFMDTIARAKPAAAKGTYIRSATVSSTMGPGVRLETAVYR